MLAYELPLWPCASAGTKLGFLRKKGVRPFARIHSVTSQNMPFDKEKTLRAAERYLEMGKIPAAVKEYCQLVEHEPNDFTTLNKIGRAHV